MCTVCTADSRCCAQTAVQWEVRSEHGFTGEVSEVCHAKKKKKKKKNAKMYVFPEEKHDF